MSTTFIQPVLQNTVGSPVSGSAGDGTPLPALSGRGGDLLVSEAHGRFYQAAYRGVTFCARSPVAGSVIPVNSATAQTFAVINPAGSGVNLELLQVRVDISATSTYVAAEIYLNAIFGAAFALMMTLTVTNIIGGVQNQLLFGGANPKSTAASAITTTSQADKHFLGIGSFDAVTTGNNRNLLRNLDGAVIAQPGTALFLTGTAAQTSIAHIEFMYNEVPV